MFLITSVPNLTFLAPVIY